MASNETDYTVSKIRRTGGERLDADMTAADIVDVLKRLSFENRFRLIEVDAAVRDFLVAALSRRK